MASKETAIDNRLIWLSMRFSERTAAQLEAMLQHFSTWGNAHFTYEDIESLYQLLHRLAGSAGTFGFIQLGQHACLLEQRIKPLLANPLQTSALAAQMIDGEFFTQLQQLPTLLQNHSPPTPAAITTPQITASPHKTQLLVFGAELAELASTLAPYGFNIHHHLLPLIEGDLNWHQTAIVIAPAQQLAAIAQWDQDQAQQHQQSVLPIICIGMENSFTTRYALAEQGVNGLFIEPVDVPKLAERIEQLGQERQEVQASKVLLLDDDQALAEHYRLVLTAAGKDVRVMAHPEDLLSVLAEFRPDIVLLDIYMPPYCGATLARMIRLEPEWLSLPIIFLSSEQDRDQQIRALAHGADEFITKPISDLQLVNTVRALCFRARQLSKLVSCDGLTGLLNHSHIKQALLHEHARVQRLGHNSTVAILDLDHFKQVNDQYGHRAGDQVIKALANLLRQRLRDTDLIGRYGGEEFVIILPECDITQAQLIFESACRHFSTVSFNSNEEKFNVTASVGLAELNFFVLPEQALNAADEALYQRKHQGRNGVNCYTPTKSTGNE